MVAFLVFCVFTVWFFFLLGCCGGFWFGVFGGFFWEVTMGVCLLMPIFEIEINTQNVNEPVFN